MASDGVICVPSFIKTGSGFQVILILSHRQPERLQVSYHQWGGSKIYAVEITSDGMIHTCQI
jgi:hypothetical protein